MASSTIDAAIAQARTAALASRTIVTLGSLGAVLIDGDTVEHVPAPTVTAIDTTGAGDAFCGALADAMARGDSLLRAVQWAVLAGAIATTRRGAIPSLPDAAAIHALAEDLPAEFPFRP